VAALPRRAEWRVPQQRGAERYAGTGSQRSQDARCADGPTSGVTGAGRRHDGGGGFTPGR
jgi:hypothetical protein